jgi:hypothetical protein
MRVACWAVAAAGLAGALSGQDPTTAPGTTAPAPTAQAPDAAIPVLRNDGAPIKVPFQCTDEDIQWAGLSCSDEEPCPVYLELSAVEPLGNKIFLAGNIHTSSATLYSVLLASDDAGRTWREAHERLRGAGLEHIQFVDFENGWIAGQMLQPLPQDPFLLITSDGGKTWRHKPMFVESRTGTIAQFWFSSRSAGSLVVDRGGGGDMGRYELYETPNGGETWLFRESNERAIRLKRAAGANPGWRIRADARTKAFLIERQMGEKWAGLGAFAVALPACKPAAAPAAPPPEEAPAPEPEPKPTAPRRAPRAN